MRRAASCGGRGEPARSVATAPFQVLENAQAAPRSLRLRKPARAADAATARPPRPPDETVTTLGAPARSPSTISTRPLCRLRLVRCGEIDDPHASPAEYPFDLFSSTLGDDRRCGRNGRRRRSPFPLAGSSAPRGSSSAPLRSTCRLAARPRSQAPADRPPHWPAFHPSCSISHLCWNRSDKTKFSMTVRSL